MPCARGGQNIWPKSGCRWCGPNRGISWRPSRLVSSLCERRPYASFAADAWGLLGSSDLLYHALWVVVAQTLDTHGIYEARQIDRGDAFGSSDDFAQTRMEADALRSKVNDEALHGALRISALASVLTTNSYLRLDPNVLFASIREGGRYLAKMGRKEVGPCIAGLRQYGMSFEEAFDEVEHLEKLIAEREGAGGLHQVGESIATTTTTTTNTNAPTNPTTASQMPTQVHTQGINHHGNIQGTMSASPNSYSISSMSNPPPSVCAGPCFSLVQQANFWFSCLVGFCVRARE